MMIRNRVSNIVDSGSVQDWQVTGDNDSISYTFKFQTQDHAHFFMNEVSRFCSKTDHHPEWRYNNSKELTVNLTSHFANNKVTVSDYELAQEMSRVYKKTQSYNPYAWFTTERLIEIGQLTFIYFSFSLAFCIYFIF